MQDRNTKISIMITGAISFLMFEASAYVSTNEIFHNLYNQVIGADILVSGFLSSTYLQEIPLSDYLDEQKEIDGAVLEYSFFSFDLDNICEADRCTLLGSKSSMST